MYSQLSTQWARLHDVYGWASQNWEKGGNFMKNHDISDKIMHFELNK